jgi:hypothetical protein
MGMWNWLFGGDMAPASMDINPATGLPMLGDIGGLDVGGNSYGVDLHQPGDHGALDVGGCIDIGIGSGSDWPY